MLKRRDYDVDSIPDDVDWNYITKTLSKNKNQIRCAHRITGERLIVALFTIDKIGVKIVRNLVADATSDGIHSTILFSSKGITPYTTREIEENKWKMETFTYDRFYFDLISHDLVKDHRILSEREKRSLLDRLSLKENQLWEIPRSDPLVCYYDAKTGTVFEYLRRNGTQEVVPVYRIVV